MDFIEGSLILKSLIVVSPGDQFVVSMIDFSGGMGMELRVLLFNFLKE